MLLKSHLSRLMLVALASCLLSADPLTVGQARAAALNVGSCGGSDQPADGPQCRKPHASHRSPNVLFFLVDDLGWKDIGCNGSSFYETPHIDQLADSGMFFSNCYAASPVCSPTRASILTGKYPNRFQITTYINPRGSNQPENWKRDTPLLPSAYRDHLPLEEVTLAEAFRQAGYRTFFAGKWHLGGTGFLPQDQGFDVNVGGHAAGGPYGGKKYFSPYGNPQMEDGPEGEHLPDRLASEAISFIDDCQGEPFFAYVSFYSVHTPLIARDDLKSKYQTKAKQPQFEQTEWGRERNRKVRLTQNHATYAAMVEAMDLAVGKVLGHLQKSGLDDNTIVVFMSDNGGLSTSEGHPTSNLPLRGGKGWLYEGGIREPMIIRWPGVAQAGSNCDHPVISTDFYPTLLQATGRPLQPQQHRDGVSLVPLLQGKSTLPGRALYWHFPHYGNQGSSPSAAVQDGGLKLIRDFETGQHQLFNLTDDQGEKNNLANQQAHAADRNRLASILDQWLEETDSRFPTTNLNYRSN